MSDRRATVRCACGRAFEATAAACPACGKPVPAGEPPKTARRAPEFLDSSRLPSIPGFRLLRRLGYGGMGDVFLAHQESLDRQVALKLLPEELARDGAYVQRFLKEARSAARLSHENIVGAYDCGEAGGRYYFAMEYVAGETVFRVVKRQKALPEAKALDIARQVTRGLRHALHHGLVHRDIKPKNLMITAEGLVKICDFGLAGEVTTADEGASEEEEVHTTPAYASPEQCRGEALDHRTDIYSLGVSLFEMLTGRRPFVAENSRALMTKQVTEAPPEPRSLNPAVSPAANDLILRMLRKKPEERFRDYEELLAALDALLDGAPAAASKTTRSQAPPRRRPALALVAGAAAALALAAALFIALRKKDEPPAPVAPAPGPAPEIDLLLEEARALEKSARGRTGQVAAVRAKWRDLEAHHRGTPHHALFTTGLMEFEARVATEAEAAAEKLIRDANHHVKAGRPAEALRELRRLPADFARTDAGARVAQRASELERVLDDTFREGLQAAADLALSGKFEEARRHLNALKPALSFLGDRGIEYLRPQQRVEIEAMAKRLSEEELEAKKRAEEAARKPAPPAPPAPEPKPAVPAPPPAPPAPPVHFAALIDPAERADAGKRAAALAHFMTSAPKSPFYLAAAVFLSREEAAWRLDGPAAAALAEYLATPALATAETVAAAEHQRLFALLSSKIAGLGGAPADALQLFACAHLEEILAKKGRVEPALLLQARLGKAPVTDLWGLPGSAARVEMARFLLRPTALGLARAAEGASASPDFAARFLGALCAMKEASFDAAAAADRMRKLGAGAPDAGWTRLCDATAERLRQGLTCEACLGQGRYPCPGCSAAGTVACPACKGGGRVVDPADLSEKTCGACKARKIAACGACGGTKSARCAACEGKKTRAFLPAGHFRFLAELAACTACAGAGGLFPNVAWPCERCDGNGRALEEVPREFARLPAWIRGREGRGLHLALRWLARHQAPEGFWSAAAWNSQCREAGCAPPPAPILPHDVALTSLALLAFTGAGLGPESALPLGGPVSGDSVRRAVAWLVSCQKADGLIASGTSVQPMTEHFLATLALASAMPLAPEKDRAGLREAVTRALRAAAAHQQKGAAWGYGAPSTASDTWSTAWAGLAMAAARDAGIDVPRSSLLPVLQWLDATTDRNTLLVAYAPPDPARVPGATEALSRPETLSALGGLARLLLEGKASTPVAAAEKLLLGLVPAPDPPRRDFVYWHCGTAFLAQREQRKGAGWTAWSQALGRELALLQDAADTCSLGSWAPDDRWGATGGRVYATAVNAFTLSIASGLRPLAGQKK